MASEGSITRWIAELECGSSQATQALWERYFPQLVQLARQKLVDSPRQMADEEDVALSAMDSFFHAAQQGRFPNLMDRNDLWRLLLRMTARKVVDLKRRESRQRRGGGRVLSASNLKTEDSKPVDWALSRIVADTPTPEFAAIMAEQCRLRLDQLTGPGQKALALAKMQGYTNQEVAQQLGVSVATVERRLRLIRKKWEQEPPS
jgi:RNA polymerase sigma factor (sigma-70 family)